jgi:hypothetical protein
MRRGCLDLALVLVICTASVQNITANTSQISRMAMLTHGAGNEGVFAAIADMSALALLHANLAAVVRARAAAWPVKLQYSSCDCLSMLRISGGSVPVSCAPHMSGYHACTISAWISQPGSVCSPRFKCICAGVTPCMTRSAAVAVPMMLQCTCAGNTTSHTLEHVLA